MDANLNECPTGVLIDFSNVSTSASSGYENGIEDMVNGRACVIEQNSNGKEEELESDFQTPFINNKTCLGAELTATKDEIRAGWRTPSPTTMVIISEEAFRIVDQLHTLETSIWDEEFPSEEEFFDEYSNKNKLEIPYELASEIKNTSSSYRVEEGIITDCKLKDKCLDTNETGFFLKEEICNVIIKNECSNFSSNVLIADYNVIDGNSVNKTDTIEENYRVTVKSLGTKNVSCPTVENLYAESIEASGKLREKSSGEPVTTDISGKPEKEFSDKLTEEVPGERVEQVSGKAAKQVSGKAAEQDPDKRAEQDPDKRAEQDPDKRAEQDPGKPAEQDPGKPAEQDPDKRAEQDPDERAEQDSGKRAEQDSGKRAEQDSGKPAEQDPGKPAEQDPDKRAEQDPDFNFRTSEDNSCAKVVMEKNGTVIKESCAVTEENSIDIGNSSPIEDFKGIALVEDDSSMIKQRLVCSESKFEVNSIKSTPSKFSRFIKSALKTPTKCSIEKENIFGDCKDKRILSAKKSSKIEQVSFAKALRESNLNRSEILTSSSDVKKPLTKRFLGKFSIGKGEKKSNTSILQDQCTETLKNTPLKPSNSLKFQQATPMKTPLCKSYSMISKPKTPNTANSLRRSNSFQTRCAEKFIPMKREKTFAAESQLKTINSSMSLDKSVRIGNEFKTPSKLASFLPKPSTNSFATPFSSNTKSHAKVSLIARPTFGSALKPINAPIQSSPQIVGFKGSASTTSKTRFPRRSELPPSLPKEINDSLSRKLFPDSTPKKRI